MVRALSFPQVRHRLFTFLPSSRDRQTACSRRHPLYRARGKQILAMAEDPALPSLATWSLGSAISSRRPSKRARPSSPVPSSDSALFSSDDDPSLDNYTRGRQKKQYRGPWFQQEPASDGTFPGSQFKVRANRDGNHKSKRIFERQYDSGVFLGSDCTDMDESSDDIELPPSRSMILPSSQAQSTQTLEPTPEELARKQIENCIEHGLESIDLSYVSYPNASIMR